MPHHEPNVGSSVDLKFRIKRGNYSSSFEVEWLKDGNTVEASWFSKYKLTTTTSNSSLTIKDVTVDDTGHYSIIVDGTESSIITVTVKGNFLIFFLNFYMFKLFIEINSFI